MNEEAELGRANAHEFNSLRNLIKSVETWLNRRTMMRAQKALAIRLAIVESDVGGLPCREILGSSKRL